MPLPEYGGTLGQKRAAHLLRRATFGATKQQIDSFAGLTPAQAITQLYRQTLPDPVLPIDPKTGSEWVLSGITPANSEGGALEEFLLRWFVGQMMNSSLAYSAREKVVLFLHTHFTMRTEKVDNTRALYFQNQLFREFALDATTADTDVNFKTLTVKASVDNAMLELLDGKLNVKGSFNENYARELLELYTIGRGLEANPPATSGEEGDYGVYREADVQTAARILTGWDFDDTFGNIDPDTNLPRGKVKGGNTNASAHDNDASKPKQFSDRFTSVLFPGNVITPDPLLMPGGVPTLESALDEITKLIDLIYEQPETARNICRKIYRFFLWAPHTDAEVMASETIIDQMAALFVSPANNFKIQPVIENLLRSQHFYDAAGGVTDDAFGGLIKSPIDLVIGTLKFFNVSVPDPTQADQYYMATGEVLGQIRRQGMNFYNPYDVAGYEAYHQYPIYHRFWITTNTLSRRYDFIRTLLDPQGTLYFNVNTYDFVKANFAAVASDSEELVKALIAYLLPHHDFLVYEDPNNNPDALTASLTVKRLNYFLTRFLTDVNMDPKGYWTTTWNQGTELAELRDWLNRLFNALLQSPEYQLA
ncbi:DUF1800 domain-containing protein [Ohtaekwangia koreensis]|uniref:Uncharacterized conserved protein, DUF1800 family n=1 Tax=Ohtaekwangia koreensis TaxID=688867 RepID=A0A1T5K8D0_9BACT|nr:DUF1800 family protein [Ohtaekwangia koreensis]SKC59870.1 Uncharacterized conserved protein, DUF1800 family [Ohtaekwangia koreensis]